MKYFNEMMWSIYQNTCGHRQMDCVLNSFPLINAFTFKLIHSGFMAIATLNKLKSELVIPLTTFILTTLALLCICFHMKFKNRFSIFMKNCIGIL